MLLLWLFLPKQRRYVGHGVWIFQWSNSETSLCLSPSLPSYFSLCLRWTMILNVKHWWWDVVERQDVWMLCCPVAKTANLPPDFVKGPVILFYFCLSLNVMIREFMDHSSLMLHQHRWCKLIPAGFSREPYMLHADVWATAFDQVSGWSSGAAGLGWHRLNLT